jgi:hypothetical protein
MVIGFRKLINLPARKDNNQKSTLLVNEKPEIQYAVSVQ